MQLNLFGKTEVKTPANDNFTRFKDFHEANPHVYELIKRFTMEAIAAGFKHYGIQSIAERVRWHTAIETEGEALKLNNNHTAYYARMFMDDYPDHEGFFRTRVLTAKGA